MSNTNRFIAFLPKKQDSVLPASLQQFASHHSLLFTTGNPYISHDQYPNSPSEHGSEFVLFHTFRHTPLLESFSNTNSGDKSWLPLGSYNRLHIMPGRLDIISDPLGVVPLYYAELPEGYLLSSHLHDLFELRPDLIHPYDPDGMATFLAVGIPFHDRTLHQRVRRLPVGAIVTWSFEKGLRITNDNRMKIPTPEVRTSFDDICEEIISAITSSLKSRVPSTCEQVILALSGGFDSRLLALISTRTDIKTRAFTYGYAYHREVKSALAVARELKLDHQLYPYIENHLDKHLQDFLEVTDCQADSVNTHLTNLTDIPLPEGIPLLHGFLGETLAGNHLAWLRSNEFRDHKTLARGISRHFLDSSLLGPETLKMLDINTTLLADEIQQHLRSDCHPYQSLMVWDMENRQRRFIAMGLPLLASRFHVVTPFYEQKVIQAWLRLPRIALDNRLLFRQLLARISPRLAAIPHSEENTTILPNLRHEVALSFRYQRDRAFTYMPGHKWLSRKFRSLHNPDIWSLLNLSDAHRRNMKIAVKSQLGTINDMFGFSIDTPLYLMLSQNNNSLRRLYSLGSYAHWLSSGDHSSSAK